MKARRFRIGESTNDFMARALKPEEAEVFKDAISPDRRFMIENASADGVLPDCDDDLDPTIESAFWLNKHFPAKNL